VKEGVAVNVGPEDIHGTNGCSAAKETTMKWFLRSLSAVLKKGKGIKPAAQPERPEPTPRLEVQSQVKAGSWNVASPKI
jgi:hypothetical protein